MSDKNEIKISKIDIKIGDKVLSLTPEETKQLKDILNATFPETVRFVPGYPVVIPQPIFIERTVNPWPKWDTTIWCNDTTNNCQTLALTCSN